MKQFDLVEAAYLEIDRFLSPSDAAQTVGATEAPAKRFLNDRAYFVLLVAQFEDFVNEAVRTLIARHREYADWPHRDLWINLTANNRDAKDIPFKLRLALLIDRQRVEYRDACGLYDARNLIAHGVLDGPLSIQTAINQLRAVASLIQEVP